VHYSRDYNLGWKQAESGNPDARDDGPMCVCGCSHREHPNNGRCCRCGCSHWRQYEKFQRKLNLWHAAGEPPMPKDSTMEDYENLARRT
jgi:hypothetical protein